MVKKRVKTEVHAFHSFLNSQNLIALVTAFILGAAAKDLTQSLIDNLIMPFINPLIGGKWQTTTIVMGSIELHWGLALSSVLNFAVLALILYIIVKKVLQRETQEEKRSIQ